MKIPTSIAMLQRDILDSIDKEAMADPANSMTCPLPPEVPMIPMICKMTSFDVTPVANVPSIETYRKVFCFVVEWSYMNSVNRDLDRFC